VARQHRSPGTTFLFQVYLFNHHHLLFTLKIKKMKRFNQLKFTIAFAVLLFFTVGCNQKASDEAPGAQPESAQANTSKPDPAKLKEEIQAQETAWANADNARDTKTVAAFYADDAVTFGNNQPMIAGRAAIEKDIEAYVGKRPKGSTVSYDVMDVFGCDDYATETGKITKKDSTGKTFYTGKYMAVWEKRDGKWLCIRDIANDDEKQK
jgi:uncharacterized protein (TIGR02246 family)